MLSQKIKSVSKPIRGDHVDTFRCERMKHCSLTSLGLWLSFAFNTSQCSQVNTLKCPVPLSTPFEKHPRGPPSCLAPFLPIQRKVLILHHRLRYIRAKGGSLGFNASLDTFPFNGGSSMVPSSRIPRVSQQCCTPGQAYVFSLLSSKICPLGIYGVRN